MNKPWTHLFIGRNGHSWVIVDVIGRNAEIEAHPTFADTLDNVGIEIGIVPTGNISGIQDTLREFHISFETVDLR